MKTLCLLSFVLLGAGAIAADGDNTLANLKTAYETRRAALTTTRDEAVGKTLAAYKAELGTLLANVRQQGNLDYVLAIEAEQKRLDAGGSAPTEPAAKEFAHLRRIQWAARQAEDKADKELGESLAALRKQYLDSLEKLEKTLVAANRIEEAKAARGEKETVEAMQAICGRWLFVGKYQRILNDDGSIYDYGDPAAIGNWTYIGDGKFRIETNQGKHVNTAWLSDDRMELRWVAANGKPYSAARQ